MEIHQTSGRRRRFLRHKLIAMTFALIATHALAQQQPDNKGTEFWLMFPGNNDAPSLDLFITGDTATNGTVDISGLGFSTAFTTTPGTITTVSIPSGAALGISDVITELGIHIVAADEVTVYGLNQRDATTDAFLGLPLDILGTEYINLGYQNVNVINGTQFGIVATDDATAVTITPSANAGARAAGVSYDVVLDKGETYLLRSASSAPADLSGSIIISDKPIALFGGHQCANIPQGFFYCDHIVEQIPPISTWGQSFVTFPLATRINGDTFRVIASEAGTTVAINGSTVATIGRGEIYETVLTSASTITANAPVLVSQYSNSSTFDNVTSDPFQAIVPPQEQFLAGYVVSTPATGFSRNFINIVAPDAALGSILLDGAVIPASDFSSIGAGFSGVAREVDLGSHALSGPLPFGLLSYGFDSFDSYGYPGGLALAEVAQLRSLILAPDTSSATVGTESCVVASTDDQNGDPLVGIRVAFETTGVNSASDFQFTNASGEAEFCYIGTNVGTDMITATSGALVDTAIKEWIDMTVRRCDIDGDDMIDQSDISKIFAARNQPASGMDDPRDEDGNGTITTNDARACVLQCTNARCAP